MADARTLIVSHDDVERLLPMPACIDLMAEALATTARGGAVLPLRQMVMLPGGRNLLAVMPAALAGAEGSSAIGAKVLNLVGVFLESPSVMP